MAQLVSPSRKLFLLDAPIRVYGVRWYSTRTMIRRYEDIENIGTTSADGGEG
jgi:hypothetical protein